ncbi:MAG: hypothetical protein VX589_08390 [Myxococcota bacterium]|nr:hypothetical protein [Myxococcota bacterium]
MIEVADVTGAHCQAPRWSADGLQLAYEVYRPKKDTRETWIAELDSASRVTKRQEVSTGRSQASTLLGGRKAPIVDFEWAPTMTLLSKPYILSSRGPKKNFDLFADGDWLTKKNPGNDGQPSWSRDGRYIAYASQRQHSGDIYVIDLGGNPDSHMRATLWPNATEFRPQWSPTKNFLLFTRSQEGRNGQDIGLVIDVRRPQDTTRMVTQWPGDEIRPSWSPDGVRIAFYSNRGYKADSKRFDLWVIGVDGNNERKLASDVVVDEHAGPAWTPDNQNILYVKRDFKRDNPIEWVRVDGSKRGVLVTNTQLNSDLVLHGRDDAWQLAFRSLGRRGAKDMVWQRIYMTQLSAKDFGGTYAP